MKDAFIITKMIDTFCGRILDGSVVTALEHMGLRCGRCCPDRHMATTWLPDSGRPGFVICNRCVAADRSVVPFENTCELVCESTPG